MKPEEQDKKWAVVEQALKMDKQKIKINIETFRKRPSIVSQAFFQILTLIISTFAFAFLISMASVVAIPTAKAATPACCEKLQGSGLFCQNAMSDSCDPAFKSAPTSCESTSFCKLGCCYDSVEGTCAENTPRKLCELRNGTFDTNADCKIAQCSMGCCVLGSEASLTSLVRCKKLASFYGLETDFRSGITNEADCIAIAQAQDKGACVITTPIETTCRFTVRTECNSLTHNASAFYKDFLCSAEQLATNCARQHHTGCVDGKDEVYWFDSCGNAENIYDSDKIRSYNSGRVLSKGQSCNSGSSNARSTECGNCDYFTGSMCGKAQTGKDPKPRYGDYICRDLNCYKTSNGKDYKHGESWCVYDGAVGEGRDIAGSRHWRHLCVNGEEKVEPCDDFRQGICVEGTTNVGGAIFTESVCRANNWRDCLEKRDSASCSKAVNCYWRDLWQGGICLPDVPPGFNLKTSEGGSVASSICNIANAQCNVIYEKKFGGWQCVQNCECEKASWTENMLKACASLGDCGAKVNIAGTLTKDGYSISGGSDASSSFLDTYNKISMSKTSSIIADLRITGAAITGLAGEGQAAADTGEKKSGGGAGDLLGLGGFLKPVQTGLTKLVSMPNAGMAWNVGINFAAAYVASKMVNSMFGLKGDAAKMTTYAGMAAATAMSAWSFFGTSSAVGASIPAAGATVGAGGAVVGASGAIVGAGGAVAGAGGVTLVGGGTIAAGVAIPASATVASGSLAAGSTVATGSTFSGGVLTTAPAFLPGLVIIIAVIIIMALIMKFMGIGKTKVKIVSFTCLPWQAPSGGADCEKCNGDEMKPCSEYRCSSLGVSCSLLNKGTGEETCVDLNPNDVNAPKIKPFESILTAGHAYTDVQPCPPGPGCWKIARTGATDGCIKAFTPLTFGVETDEPAQCKIEYNHTAKFDDMQYWFGDNIYLYNHSMQMSLPGPEHINAQSPEIQNDGKYTLFVRCRDGNGNANTAEMAMQFCVEPGPDTTPSMIMRTSIDNGAPVAYGTKNTALDIYLNEPAECKWSRTDQAYENMNSTFDCTINIYQMEWDMTYKCSGTLTGISDKVSNTYYFRCKDQPWLIGTANETDRNANKESYVFTLQGTQPLNISKIEPNGTISYGSEPIPVTLKVETVNGYNYGESTCFFSPSSYENMIEFFTTGTDEHEQKLDLPEGSYNYYILCRDLGGNFDKVKTEFKAEVDKIPPIIARVYQDAGMLKIITDEESECRYSIKDCNFDFTSATEMPFTLSTEHTAEWRTDITYFIKCMDKFGNMPASSECTMQVNAYDVPIG